MSDVVTLPPDSPGAGGLLPATPIGAASSTLPALLERVRRRMVWRYTLPWLARGSGVGLFLAAATLAVGRWLGRDGALWIALAFIGMGLLAGGDVARRRRPDRQSLLHHADRLLGLDERLSTAAEFDGGAPILFLQRSDLIGRLARIDLARGLPVRPGRRDFSLAAAGVAVCLLVFAIPSPGAARNAAVAVHARDAVAHAATGVANARALSVLPPATRAALGPAGKKRQAAVQRILNALQRRLRSTRTPAAAQRAIAAARQSLAALTNPSAAAEHAALSASSNALASSSTAKPLSSALAAGDPRAIKAAAQRLAATAAQAAPASQANLSKALQGAANAATSDPKLAAALQNAATSLAQGDAPGVQSALGQAGVRGAADAADSAQQNALASATGALDGASNAVAGLPEKTTAQVSGAAAGAHPSATGPRAKGAGSGSRQGAGAGSGTGKGSGSGKGAGAGSGTGTGNGRGTGTGSSSGQGSGAGTGQGQGSGSGAGSGGRGTRSTGGTGSSNARIYVPNVSGRGPSTETNGSKAVPAAGSLQPWRSVAPRYQSGVRDYVDNPANPADGRALVKRYFAALNH